MMERRQSDERMSELYQMIKEIHQRQEEVTLPCLQEHKDTISELSSKVSDLLNEHIACQMKVCNLEKRIDAIPKYAGYLVALIAGIFGAIDFIWRHK